MYAGRRIELRWGYCGNSAAAKHDRPRLRDGGRASPMNVATGQAGRIKEIEDRSDMRCSAHWLLYERYVRRALWIDLTIMALSSWLVAMAFVEPRIGVKLAPLGIDSQI